MANAAAYQAVGPYRVLTYHENRSDYILGHGSFGEVFKAFCGNEHVYAAKRIAISRLTQKQSDIAYNEYLPDAKNLDHPNIIKIVYVERIMNDLWIIMEYCNYTLYKYLKKLNPHPNDRKAIIYQMVCGIEYLHRKRLAHRDIKPDNIMIKQAVSWPWVKVTDFSLAKDLSDRDSSWMNTIRGNPHWMAPEMLDERGYFISDMATKYNRSVDIYSLGLVCAFTCMDKKGQFIIRRGTSECGHADVDEDGSVYCGAQQNQDPRLDLVNDYFSPHWIPELGQLKPIIRRMVAFDAEYRPRHISGHLQNVFPDVVFGVKEFLNQSMEDTPDLYVGKLPTSNKKPASTNPQLFVLGGLFSSSKPNGKGWLSDGSPTSWKQCMKFPSVDTGVTICPTEDGLITVIPNKKTRSCLCYRFGLYTRKWTQLRSMPRYCTCSSSVILRDVLYVIGGGYYQDGKFIPVANCEYMDMSHQHWSKTQSMMQGMLWPVTTVLQDKIYVLFNDHCYNKITQTGRSRSLQMFNPDTERWQMLQALPDKFGRTNGCQAIAIDDYMLVIGGYDMICAKYKPMFNTWTGLTTSPFKRAGPALAIHDRRVLVTGGEWWNDDDKEWQTSTLVQEYDVDEDSWHVSDIKLPFALSHHVVTILERW